MIRFETGKAFRYKSHYRESDGESNAPITIHRTLYVAQTTNLIITNN